MRTPEEIYDEWLKGDVADSTVDFFREVQKEAWNEATKQAEKSVCFISIVCNKRAILDNLIP